MYKTTALPTELQVHFVYNVLYAKNNTTALPTWVDAYWLTTSRNQVARATGAYLKTLTAKLYQKIAIISNVYKKHFTKWKYIYKITLDLLKRDNCTILIFKEIEYGRNNWFNDNRTAPNTSI